MLVGLCIPHKGLSIEVHVKFEVEDRRKDNRISSPSMSYGDSEHIETSIEITHTIAVLHPK